MSKFAKIAASVVAVVALLTGCAPAKTSNGSDVQSLTITPGKLTIATGSPAYEPWVIADKPESQKGFESAVAYAVAKKLGFAAKDVVWVRTTFDEAIAPGVKNFDFNLQQFSITADRKKAVDFSTPYYTTTQTVITIKGSPAEAATSIADLKGLVIGAAVGTTSYDSIGKVIAPTAKAQAFNNNDDAVAALKSGQVDAIVVDLPTALYLTAVELTGGKIIGQLAGDNGGDNFGLVLDKGSKLTKPVSDAVDALRADGTLKALADKWLAGYAGVPVLK